MIKKTLYKHQQEAVDAAINAVKQGQKAFYLNCCVSFGKSLVISHMCNMVLRKGNRALVLTPSKELCEQNYKESVGYMENPSDIGIVCAGLNKKQQSRKCVIATYQSFLSLRAHSGEFAVVFHDEAHGMSNNEDTSVRKIIKSLMRLNPNLIVIGLTGSPFRMGGQGELHNANQDGDSFYKECVYNSDISEMIRLGYLSHVESISGDVEIDLSGSEFNNGISTDYNTKLVSVKFDEILIPAVKDMRVKFSIYKIKTAVIFTSTIENADRVVDQWGNQDEMKVLHGGMSNGDRARTLYWMPHGTGNRYIVNVGILIAGWNMPALDCVALLMTTKSISKYIQCCGRVIRAYICENGIEKVGLIYDVGGNISRHGSLNNLNIPANRKKKGEAPRKLCDITLARDCTDKQGFIHYSGNACNTPNLLSAKKCTTCGSHFIIDEDGEGGYSMRSHAQILSDKIDNSIIEYDISDVDFEIAQSRSGANAGTKMIKMRLFDDALNLIHEHYFCLNHKGFAKENSKRFLRNMFKNQTDYYKLGAVGLSVDNILPLVNNHYHAFFKTIIGVSIGNQKSSTKYKEIKSITFDK